MNDERLGREIGDFYRETDVKPPNSKQSAREVAARLPHVEQVTRRHWRPAWLTRATKELDPILAASGHTPTVIGRTQSMLSPAKAITAGALIFAIGGAFLIAQPFDRQGSVPGAQTDDYITPVEVTGTPASPAGCLETRTEGELDDTVARLSLWACSTENGMPWSMSDRRLEGTVERINEETRTVLEDGTDLYIAQSAISIENDGGAWRERPRQWLLSDFDWLPDEVIVLDGDGEYAGLVAVLRATGPLSDFHGYIIDERLYPPAPDNAST